MGWQVASELSTVGRLTARFGVYEAQTQDGLQEMLKWADQALYRSKEAGRNWVTCIEAKS